ncbi:MAG: archaellin/type IV pilin N-terminal domain-containing protein [Candidatus Woesearchaeota archaeon]
MSMKKNSVFASRKGISPLIATILLIAFAVALGSVVYTYFILLVDDTALQGCSRFVSLSSTPDRAGDYVYDVDSSGVRVNVYNEGPNPVEAITYVVEGTRENLVVEKKMQSISPAVSRWITIENYDTDVYGEIRRIVITPHYTHSGALRICTEGRLEVIKRRTG